MKLPVMSAEGKELRKVDVDDSVFGIKPNGSVLHQAYVTQRNNQRWGTAQTRTRGEVTASSAKLRRQKGSGRARVGTAASPTRVGGGTAFGPRMRDYSQALPKKMRRLAIRSALSGKAADGQLVVIDKLAFDAPKTKEMIRILQNVGINRSALIVTSESDRTLLASARNLSRTKVLPARYLNVADMLNHNGLLMTIDAVRIAEELWAVKSAPAKEDAAEKRPARRTRAKAKAEAEAPAAEAEAPAAEAVAESPVEEKRPARRGRAAAAPADAPEAEKKPARSVGGPRARRTAKAEASAKDTPAEEKPKRATRSRAKAAEGDAAADKPKPARRRTTKKTEDTPESEG
jgi:large subunit ribosomal protein L4